MTVFLVGCVVTLVAGVVLEVAGNDLANRAGINGVIFGATVLSVASALPEISSGIAAVRLGDNELAVADIFGGNSFQVVLFLLADLIAGQAGAAERRQPQRLARRARDRAHGHVRLRGDPAPREVQRPSRTGLADRGRGVRPRHRRAVRHPALTPCRPVYGRAMLTLEELRADVETGAVDTVIAAFTDMQGRLMGKRLHAEFFLEELDAGHEVEGCNYLLALEMEMDPVPGYALASWETGYGDFGLQPDLATLRRVPWHEATALVLCDVVWHDGSPVAPSPRQVLKAQVEKAHALGYDAMFGSELEFFLLARELRRGAREALPRPHAVGAVHPRLPHPRLGLRRAVPARGAARDGGGGHARRVARRARRGRASTRSTSATRTR